MLSQTPRILLLTLLFWSFVVPDVTGSWYSQSKSSHPHRRREAENEPDSHGLAEYDDKAPLGMWVGNDGQPLVQENEDDMAAPNFNSMGQEGETLSDGSTYSTGMLGRLGPHHKKPSTLAQFTNRETRTSKLHKRRSTVVVNKNGAPPSILATYTAINQVESKDNKDKISKPTENLQEAKHELLPTPLPVSLPNKNKTKPSSERVVTLHKREDHMSLQDQRKVIGELGEILKDDDSKVKKTPPDVKRQTSEESVDTKEKQNTLEENIDKSSGQESDQIPTDKQSFDEWLRNEYYRNMALSLATAKRKRNSVTSVLGPDLRRKRKVELDVEEPNTEESYEPENEIDLLPENFDPESAQERLQVLENAVLNEAVEKIVERARETAMAEAAKEQVAQMLAEAFYLEKLQQSLEDKYHRGHGESQSESDIFNHRTKTRQAAQHRHRGLQLDKPGSSWGRFDQEDNADSEIWPDDLVSKRSKGNLVDALNIMAPSDINKKRESDSIPDCPELRLLTSDCSSLEENLPPDTGVSPELKHVCNKHEVCYSCGEVFGLTSSACDAQFVRQASRLCEEESEDCQPSDLARLLEPLRERRVFYKRSVPPVCIKAHVCIGRFLNEA